MSSETKTLFKKDSFSDNRMLWTNIEKDSKLYSEISEVLKKSYPPPTRQTCTCKGSEHPNLKPPPLSGL